MLTDTPSAATRAMHLTSPLALLGNPKQTSNQESLNTFEWIFCHLKFGIFEFCPDLGFEVSAASVVRGMLGLGICNLRHKAAIRNFRDLPGRGGVEHFVRVWRRTLRRLDEKVIIAVESGKDWVLR